MLNGNFFFASFTNGQFPKISFYNGNINGASSNDATFPNFTIGRALTTNASFSEDALMKGACMMDLPHTCARQKDAALIRPEKWIHLQFIH